MEIVLFVVFLAVLALSGVAMVVQSEDRARRNSAMDDLLAGDGKLWD
ncbi:hypothetical protein [Henriciella sp.]|nr:hypothetical protein [Henriciella sp.]